MKIDEEIRSYVRLVENMRERQISYFKHRSSDNLADAKRLERKVDKMTADVLAGPQLFPFDPGTDRTDGAA